MPFDLALDENGDLPAITKPIDGIDLVLQRVRIRLRLALGNYIGDQTKGLDYLGFQNRPQDVTAIGDQIRAEIESTPGVSRALEFTGEQDGETLRYNARIFVQADSQAEEDLVALTVVTGNSQPAILTYHRASRIAPLP